MSFDRTSSVKSDPNLSDGLGEIARGGDMGGLGWFGGVSKGGLFPLAMTAESVGLVMLLPSLLAAFTALSS